MNGRRSPGDIDESATPLADGWQRVERPPSLFRRFTFASYAHTRAFLDRLAALSEETGLYPGSRLRNDVRQRDRLRRRRRAAGARAGRRSRGARRRWRKRRRRKYDAGHGVDVAVCVVSDRVGRVLLAERTARQRRPASGSFPAARSMPAKRRATRRRGNSKKRSAFARARSRHG